MVRRRRVGVDRRLAQRRNVAARRPAARRARSRRTPCTGRGSRTGRSGSPPRSDPGSSRSSAVAETSMPGVQNPHCTPPCRRNARWSGASSSSPARPSTVVTSPAFRLEREVGAGVHRLAVEQHHARAALGVVAALLGAGQAELLADGREQADVRVELDRVGRAVHGEGRSDLHRSLLSSRRAAAGLAGIGTSTARAGERGGDRAARDDLGHRPAVLGRPADVADRGRRRRRPLRRPRPRPRRRRRSRSAPPRRRARGGSSARAR